jgi:hypothetical protein
VQFPQAGNWAGEFELNSGTMQVAETGLAPSSDSPSEVYMSTLEPELTINGKGDQSAAPQAPLTSGTIVYSNGNEQFTLTGTSPNTEFTGTECGVLGGSSCYLMYNSTKQSQFTTNAQGNVSFTVEQDGSYGDIFLAEPPSGSGFIGGFTVP